MVICYLNVFIKLLGNKQAKKACLLVSNQTVTQDAEEQNLL